MVNPRFLGALRQRVLDHMRRLAGEDKQSELATGLSPSEAIEVESMLQAASAAHQHQQQAQQRHPRPPSSSSRMNPQRAPLGRAPATAHATAPHPPSAAPSGGSLSEDDLVSIAKKFLAARGISCRARPQPLPPQNRSASVATYFQQQPKQPPATSAAPGSPAGRQRSPASTPRRAAVAATDGDDGSNHRAVLMTQSQREFAAFEQKQREQQAEQRARQAALDEAIAAAAQRQQKEPVKTHERLFPLYRTNTAAAAGGDVSQPRGAGGNSSAGNSSAGNLPPTQSMLQQLSELRSAGHGRGRPQSATAAAPAVQGIAALERLRDTLAQRRLGEQERQERFRSDFFFEQHDSGTVIEGVAGWTPDRRDALKAKFKLGRAALVSGLDEQRRQAEAASEARRRAVRAENERVSQFIADSEREAAERRRAAAQQRDRAAAEAGQELEQKVADRRESLQQQHDRERRQVEAALEAAREEERARKAEEARKRERLRRELAADANNARARREAAQRQKQAEEARLLDDIHRDLVRDRAEKEHQLVLAWDKHKRHAEALRQAADEHRKQSSQAEQAAARMQADAARAEDDREREAAVLHKRDKQAEHRHELLLQMYGRSAQQRVRREQDREQSAKTIADDLDSKSSRNYARMHDVLAKQEEHRRFLELQMQVAALKGDAEDEPRVASRLKARRVMHSVTTGRPRWSEAALAGDAAATASAAAGGIELRPSSADVGPSTARTASSASATRRMW